jgi:hypothetical protein
MCTSIIEIARAEGMAKRGDEWFPLSQAVVAYDHARHAPLGDVITLDFINTGLDPGARAGIELTLETAKELRAALDRAIAAAEFEEAEVRGQGRRAQPRSGSVTREMRRPRALAAAEHSAAMMSRAVVPAGSHLRECRLLAGSIRCPHQARRRGLGRQVTMAEYRANRVSVTRDPLV